MAKLKKFGVAFLAFLLVFSNFAFTAAAAPGQITPADLSKNIQNESNEKVTQVELDELYSPEDKVRVIIEVEGDPAIKQATLKGKKFSDLPEAEKASLHAENLAKQDVVKKELASKKIQPEYAESFTTIFNGFSGVISYGEMELIKKTPGVANVTISTEYERPEVTPEMKYSKELVEAQQTWDEYGYDGEGMIVGVIDSGADPNHRDFVLSEDTEAALSEEEVNNYITENGLPGQFYNEKVPYGYNYMDNSPEIRDRNQDASMHGMHVSGTVLANGDEENGGIKGVAPEAQLLALKVFGNDPDMGSTWGDIYIRAMEDSIILGADVINMSLGSVAAFVDPENAEQEAIANAVDNGILFSISAGNSAHFGNGAMNPRASNPDIGVVGAPGVTYESLQVASLENSHMDMEALDFAYGDNSGAAPFMSASSVHPETLDGAFELEYVGIGDADGFAGKDLTGKFALALRGNTFTDTAYNAMAANAEGVIVYNHSDGWVNMASEPGITIPQLFMAKTDGDELKAALDAGETVTIEFNGEVVTAKNALADTVSAFSSWGATPNLDFKPEIMAPGGNILSTLEEDSYGTMSGTSMAAPHVAGGAALILQRVNEDFPELEGADRVNMAKNILMNTAAPVVDKGAFNAAYGSGETPYSPRRQGAGLMQLHAASATPVVVTEQETNEAKVALREINNEASFTLSATNVSDEDVTYDLSANLQSDLQLFGLMGNANATGVLDELEAAEIAGAEVVLNGGETSLTVPAGETVSFDVSFDLSEAGILSVTEEGSITFVDPAEIFPNGYFVEGYVTLTNEAVPALSVPFMGFNGDWNAAPILDEFAYSDIEEGKESFYEDAGLLYQGADGGFYYLGYDPITGERILDNVAISPNGDGQNDNILPILSFLRNAVSVEYNVLDADGNKLKTVSSQENVRKNYFDGGEGPSYYLSAAHAWDGTVSNEVVEDGEYIYEILAQLDYEGKEAQSVKVDVTVDTVAPELETTLDGNNVLIEASDDRSGLSYFELVINGASAGLLSPETEGFALPEGLNLENDRVELVAVDNAGNAATSLLSVDNDIPEIFMLSMELGDVFTTSTVPFAGAIEDASEIVEFTINGEDVEVTHDFNTGVHYFNTTFEFEDGVHIPEIYAKDAHGNETWLANSKLFYVDTEAATVELSAPTSVGSDVETATIEATISDNFEQLRVLLDGDEIAKHALSGDVMNATTVVETAEVSLEPGKNTFEVTAVDLGGHETTESITIYRAESADEEAVTRIEGKDRYVTAVELSKAGWDSAETVVLARGDQFADALAGVPLAEKFDAPLLLTQPETFTKATADEIARLGAKNVYILGGEVAIDSSIQAELSAQGLNVTRVDGDTRIETAIQIAEIVLEDQSTNTAVVVDGYNYPDALSVASYAAKEGFPILLTQSEKLPEATKVALQDFGINSTLIVGGEVAVSSDVAVLLPGITRVSGDNRMETAIEVAKYFNPNTNEFYVTTGYNFPDALAAGALAAKEGTGVILVNKEVEEFQEEFINEKRITKFNVIGGEMAVSQDLVDQLNNLLK